MDITKLDKVFSEYIRRCDVDHRGYVKCCTCPTVLHWKQMDCGHWRKRGNILVRWKTRNAGPQCVVCNRHKDGEYDKMEIYLLKRYGTGSVIEIYEISLQSGKLIQYEIDELVEEYKQKIKELNK